MEEGTRTSSRVVSTILRLFSFVCSNVIEDNNGARFELRDQIFSM